MNVPFNIAPSLPSLERVRELFAYDPGTGVVTWRVSRPGTASGTVAGTLSHGYLQVQIDWKFLKLHRVIWLMQTGNWPVHHIDHINRNRSDNRWCNLREATPLQNSRNRSLSRRNKSGHVGVCWDRRLEKWEANIGVGSRTLKIGCFEVIQDAISARCEAEKHYFGEFARDARAAR
jgi:HNH endonuclease